MLDQEVLKRVGEFRGEVETIRNTFSQGRRFDEEMLLRGSKHRGRIIEGSFSRWPNDDVKIAIDDSRVYLGCLRLTEARREEVLRLTGRLPRARREGNAAVGARLAKILQDGSVHDFTVEEVDTVNLVAYLSFGELDGFLDNLAGMEVLGGGTGVPATTGGAESGKGMRILGGRPLLIDGNNVVRQDNVHGWRVLRALVDLLRRDGVAYHVYFDATIDHVVTDEEGRSFIGALMWERNDGGDATRCPSRDEADKFILHAADKTGSHVLSNDGYRQWDGQYPWIAIRNNTGEVRRVHKFTVENDHLSIPDLDVYEALGGSPW